MKNKRWICHVLEITRWVCVIIGFQCAFLSSGNPVEQFHILTIWIVAGLAGLTGIESIFFGKIASSVTGYTPSAYQRQSGMNNLALAITSLIVFLCNWGTYAELTVMSVLLIFLFLSACNHGYSAWKENNLNLKNILRPVMTLLLIAFVIPFIIRALNTV